MSWQLVWRDGDAIGKSGFVQARLMGYMRGLDFPFVELAEIEFHAPIYYVNLTRHVKGYVKAQHDGPAQFKSLEEAKAWAVAVVGMS